MMEPEVAELWIYSVLSGDATLAALVGERIYGYLAPAGTAPPYLIYSYQGGHDVRGVGTARVMSDLVYQVKGVVQGESFATADDIAGRVDTLLNGASGTASGGVVFGSVREQPIRYTEIAEGVQYRHSGGLFRVWTQQT